MSDINISAFLQILHCVHLPSDLVVWLLDSSRYFSLIMPALSSCFSTKLLQILKSYPWNIFQEEPSSNITLSSFTAPSTMSYFIDSLFPVQEKAASSTRGKHNHATPHQDAWYIVSNSQSACADANKDILIQRQTAMCVCKSQEVE